MYRLITPQESQQLPLRMLFEPTADGLFRRAAEADSFRGLVAALIGDPDYESALSEDRLVERLRVAHDAALMLRLEGRAVSVSDHAGPDSINVASDEPLLRSLDGLGLVSLAPGAEADA
ncbi:MAG: hypothetical protein M3256_05905 [Actinomycetota bacterium]|nr:hypothetical protein [Actinomycetota bacterium]